MAALVGGINWAQQAGAAWTWAKKSATAGAVFLAGLPRTCMLGPQNHSTIGSTP